MSVARIVVWLAVVSTGCAGAAGEGRTEPPTGEPTTNGPSGRSRCHPHDCDSRASEKLEFEDMPGPEDEFWCDAPGTPESKAGGGQCLLTKDECVAHAEHLQSTYGHPGKGACVEQDEAWCFQQLYWGERMQVCRSTEQSCEAHRQGQVGDDRVTAITAKCEERD